MARILYGVKSLAMITVMGIKKRLLRVINACTIYKEKNTKGDFCNEKESANDSFSGDGIINFYVRMWNF